MPIVQFKSKERIEQQHRLMLELEAKCSDCELLKNESPDNQYLYIVNDREYTQLAMLAVAQYNRCRTYAVHTPEDITEEQLGAFEFLLREIEQYTTPNEQIIVFSKKSFDTIKKYSYGRIINVKLYV